jgi:hypothetical protein
MVTQTRLIVSLYVHCLFFFPCRHMKSRAENWNIQGVFKNMLVQTWGVSSAHQKKKEQFLTMYVRKHLLFEGQPPISPNLSPVDFYLWDTRIPIVLISNWTWRDTLPTHSWCLSNICNCPGTCDRVWQSVIAHGDVALIPVEDAYELIFYSICNCMCFSSKSLTATLYCLTCICFLSVYTVYFILDFIF